jgi:hypothetical protein
MVVTLGEAKSILTAQTTGFLASAPYPFTYTLYAYTGCGCGKTTCGLYCYAQFMPNWTHHNSGFACCFDKRHCSRGGPTCRIPHHLAPWNICFYSDRGHSFNIG